MALHRVCPETDMAIGDARKLALSPPIAIFRTEEGFFATDDVCSHALASLSEGYVEADTVECPVHMARFCLKSGRPLSPPATRPIATFEVVLKDGDVFVQVDR